jgi:hypothetical protein
MTTEVSIKTFTNYINDFYGPRGIYKTEGRTTPLTESEVALATGIHIGEGKISWGGGDTVDRESVRDILIRMNVINPFKD